MMLAMAAFGQTAPATAKGPYKAIEFERFTVRQGVEFSDKELDELMNAAVKNFTRSNRFDSVTMAGATPVEVAGPKLKISGEITKFVKGNQAARYLIGFGAGKTKIMVDVKMTDASTGEVVFNQVVDGDVTWGVFGGDSDAAKGGVADEVIREMKKRGLAGDKKKTK
jgi:curli biogenesis system outer membrane secretion channel CsgG